MKRHLEAGDVAELVSIKSVKDQIPLFVGNGYLIREVAQLSDAPMHFYLFGGMGLALGVAIGYMRATETPRALILEGDGNFYMGLTGALLCSEAKLAVVHVVCANGVYESTGGQALPCRPQNVRLLAEALGYTAFFTASDRQSLQECLERATGLEGPSLIWGTAARRSLAAPARPQTDARSIAARFRRWSLERGPGA